MIVEARARIEDAKQRGYARVVYLKCDAEELARRLRVGPGDRPSLTGGDPAEEIAAVLAEREPTYQAVADSVIESTRGGPERVADQLAAMLRERGS
jgi:shikimate kinase